jgi:hypothetical protein
MTITTLPIKASIINPELKSASTVTLQVNDRYPRAYARKPSGIIKYSDFLNKGPLKASFGGTWMWSMTSYDNSNASGWRHIYPADYFPGIQAGDPFTIVGGMNRGWTTDHIAAYTFIYGTDAGDAANYYGRQPASIEFYMGPGSGGKNHEMIFSYRGTDNVQVSGHYGYGGSSTSWGIADLYILGIWYGPYAAAAGQVYYSNAAGTDLQARQFGLQVPLESWIKNNPKNTEPVQPSR